MLRVYQNNYSFKNNDKLESVKSTIKQDISKKQSPFKESTKYKSYQKSQYIRQSSVKHRSQRIFKKQKNEFQYHPKGPFPKPKIYRSYSQVKNKNIKNNQKEEFLIRIPKDQNAIENYIQQLKQLKRKIAQQKQGLNSYKKQRAEKQFHKRSEFINKFENQIDETKNNDQPFALMSLKNQQNFSRSPSDRKVFIRDKKKHLTKLKIVKQFIEQNNEDSQEDHIIETKEKQQLKEFELRTYKNESSREKNNENYDIQEKIKNFWPRKIIYGDVINVKQQILLKNPFEMKKFNRYSSEHGRKLYSISKSVDFKSNIKQKCITEHKIQKFSNSKSLVLRRKTDQNDKKIVNSSPIKSNQTLYRVGSPKKAQFIEKNKVKTSSQKNLKLSPEKQQKNNNQNSYKISPTKIKIEKASQIKNPFKSIEGLSTIQDKKQTLDVLGQSCMQIKQNLIRSNKKMDHILDMLGYNTMDLKENCNEKQKKRKMSYQRFSKAFPKGFFK